MHSSHARIWCRCKPKLILTLCYIITRDLWPLHSKSTETAGTTKVVILLNLLSSSFLTALMYKGRQIKMVNNIVLCMLAYAEHRCKKNRLFSPPFSRMKLMICCWSVSCNVVRNLSHCSSVTRRSSTALALLYAAPFSLRMSSYCLRVSTPRLSSWSSSPKSGSIMSVSRDFLTESKMCGASPGNTVIHS